MKAEVVVIGAGAIGLTLAYELSRRGRDVIVVERDRLAMVDDKVTSATVPRRSASAWAAAGILPPANLASATDPIDRLRGYSHQLFPELTSRLKSETGIDVQLDRCGGWYLADTPGETASMIGMVSYWNELEIECSEVALDEFVRREPALSDWAGRSGSAHAWWVPEEYQLCTPLFLHALVLACQNRGVRILDHTKVVDVDQSASGGEVVYGDIGCGDAEVSHQRIEAEQVVVCGGTWSGLISERLRLSKSLVPVRGQMLLLQGEPGTFNSILNFGHRYLVPRRDGTVLVGSCEEEVGFQHGTTPAVLADLRQFVRQVCPQLSTARELQAWSGLRPLTFDGFPMCGKLPGSDSIYLATGHFRSGIHLSAGTAVCMADVMAGQSPEIDMDVFRVGKQQSQRQIGLGSDKA